MSDFDPDPPAHPSALFDGVPDPPELTDFWFDWGPVFYRRRLDGSARVFCVASDPGPTERIAGRSLVGNAGQRVQGFRSKLSLTQSYVCLNAWAYALHHSSAFPERDRLDDAAQLEWRNAVYDAATGPDLKAGIAFGFMAQAAVGLWSSLPEEIDPHNVPHPSDTSRGVLPPGTTEWPSPRFSDESIPARPDTMSSRRKEF